MPVPVVHVTGTGAHDGDSGTACCGNTGQHGDILHTGSSRHHSGTARRENSGFHGGIHLLQTQTGPHRGLQPLGLPVPGPLKTTIVLRLYRRRHHRVSGRCRLQHGTRIPCRIRRRAGTDSTGQNDNGFIRTMVLCRQR